MRTGIAAVCLVAAGCTSENELLFTATLQSETNGVALSDDGLDGFAGMVGTTCTIDTNWGCPTGDADIDDTTEERVVDHYRGRTLASSSSGLHTILADGWLPDDDVSVASLRTAALYDGGQVVVSGTPHSCWFQPGDAPAVQVSGAACDEGASFSVDRSEGSLFVVSGREVLELDRSGSSALADLEDLVAFDSKLKLLYTAISGDDRLRALDRQGEEVWNVGTRGPIVEIAARGRRGEVLVTIERSDGLGAMERRDGRTGRLLGTSLLPDTEGDLVVSDNGRTVAVVREGEVSFFDLETDGDEPIVDDTPPECITPTVGGGGVNLGD